MPIYEFECLKCHTEFEELVLRVNSEVTCPGCQSDDVKRLLSVAVVRGGRKSGGSGSSGGSCAGCSSGSCGSCK